MLLKAMIPTSRFSRLTTGSRRISSSAMLAATSSTSWSSKQYLMPSLMILHGRCGCEVFGDRTKGDVAIRQHADELVFPVHGHAADVLFAHQQRRFGNRLFRGREEHVLRHHIAHALHDSTAPSEKLACPRGQSTASRD